MDDKHIYYGAELNGKWVESWSTRVPDAEIGKLISEFMPGTIIRVFGNAEDHREWLESVTP